MRMDDGSSVEEEIFLTPELAFVNESNTVQPGDGNTPAWHFKGQDGYVLFIPAGTLFAPVLRDANGDRLDDDTRIIIQKLNKQGDKLGNGVVLNDKLSNYDEEEFRNDPDYMRYTQESLQLDERERAAIFLEIPDGAEPFDPDASSFSIGDTTSEFRTPVEVIDHSNLSGEESAAVRRASQATGGSGGQ